MRYVELIPGRRSSVLGFGCAPILGAVDRSTAERALGVALDAGITHLDLARSYGFGEAEECVGSFIRGRRDEMVLATKFGIQATWLARAAAPLKPLVRRLRPRLNAPVDAPAGVPRPAPRSVFGSLLHRPVELTPGEMTRSVECSLRALRTDRLDILLLHEPGEVIARFDDLQEAAGRLKTAGKILGWGIAASVAHLDLHRAHMGCFDVLQMEVPAEAPAYRQWQELRTGLPTVLFSPRRGWAERTSVSLEGRLARYWRDFPSAVVLCSMFSFGHIRTNTEVASRS